MIKCPVCDVGNLFVKKGIDKISVSSKWELYLYLGSTCQCETNHHLEKIYFKRVYDGMPEVVFCYDDSAPSGEIKYLMGLDESQMNDDDLYP